VEMLSEPEVLPMAVGEVLTHRPLVNQRSGLSVAPPTAAQAARIFMEGMKK
jgi:hypothetical protein